MNKLYWCDIGYACFGIETYKDTVINVAPIAHWMLGKTIQSIKHWLIKQKAKVIEVNTKH